MILIRPSRIYISSANADMRKGIDGFASIVSQKFRLDPLTDMRRAAAPNRMLLQ